MRRIALFLLALAACAGCVSPESEPACPDPETVASPALIAAREYAKSLPEAIRRYADARVDREDEEGGAARDALGIDARSAARIPKIRHAALLAELYAPQNDAIPTFFIRDGIQTHLGRALWKNLGELDAHAIDPASFGLEKLRAAWELWEKSQESAKAEFALNDYEIQALAEVLPADAGDEYLAETLCDFDKTPVPRIAAQCQIACDRKRGVGGLALALELAFADAWLTWAETVKLGNTDVFSPEETEKYTTEEAREIHPKHFDKIVNARLTTAWNDFVGAENEDAAAAAMAALLPQHEQYARLQTARAKYREIVQNGGWNVVPPDRMFAGGHAPLVRDLKKRLAAEGYYDGPDDDHYDAALTAAIRAYQHHHQLEETGEVGDVFWRSLNVPAAQRLAEIEANIRHWHRSVFEPRTSYVYVNIPSFAVELWHEGKRVATHRAVVGSSTRICNTRTREWELMNSTRLMHAQMTYLVFNPYWNVPPRIEVDEFQPRIAADPKWLEKSDFEYYFPKGGGRVLRQKPGPDNSLGRVKLIFPNRYNIYIHDTPKQAMFNYPVRAFSHGCMRVEKAMDFAREVLEIDGQWDKKKVDRLFKEKGEHPIDLLHPLDVFIDYHTVTVDDEGAAYFLADVYRKIRDEISPPTAAQRRCDPNVDRTSQFRSGATADTGP